MHIHVFSADGEAKFWIEPIVALAENIGFSKKQLNELQKVVEARNVEITKSWKKHFN